MVRCAILRGHRKQNSLPSHPLQLVFCFIHQIVERGVEALKILDKGNQSVVLARIVHHCHQQIIRPFHAVAVLKFDIVQIGGDNGLDEQFLSVLATVHMGAVQVRLASDRNFFGAILADFIVFLRGDMPELPIKGLAVGIAQGSGDRVENILLNLFVSFHKIGKIRLFLYLSFFS